MNSQFYIAVRCTAVPYTTLFRHQSPPATHIDSYRPLDEKGRYPTALRKCAPSVGYDSDLAGEAELWLRYMQ